MVSDDSKIASFSIDLYKCYSELPLDVMDTLRYSVYIIDYNWVYLFLNKNCLEVLGERVGSWIGKSALDVLRIRNSKPFLIASSMGLIPKVFAMRLFILRCAEDR